jgi:biotin carboxylase
VLVEEYLAGGKEYSIECLSFAGTHQVIQYTEKESSGPPHFVETAHHQPADLPEYMKRKIDGAVDDVLSVLGLNCGMAHLELKIIDDQLYFIEVGARGGGDHIADVLTVKSTDFDYFKAAIECALGVYKPSEPHTIAYSGIYFHCQQNRHLVRLFKVARSAEWCIADTVMDSRFHEANTNVEASDSGYIIYCADHKITNEDA